MPHDREEFNAELEQLFQRHDCTTVIERMIYVGTFLWNQAQREGMGKGEFAMRIVSAAVEKAEAAGFYGGGVPPR
jgi:hypothetical protein